MMRRLRLMLLPVVALLVFTAGAPRATEAQTPVSIHDIQHTTDPSGDSPLAGQTVTTQGVVSAVGSDGYVIQDRQGGAWSGVYVYDGANTGAVSPGDEVELTGEVSEYYGLTELSDVTSLEVKSTGNGVPTVELSASDAMTEAYEGVLVATYAVTVTNPDLGYGEWEISDPSGSAVVSDEFYAYSPTQDQAMTMVRGVVWYGYGIYKIQPRSAADIVDASQFTIYDIQYPGGESPEVGNTVAVTGTVVGAYPDGYVLEHPSGGPWSGVYVYDGDHSPALGDLVTLTGEVSEYNGLTELSDVSDYSVVSSGNPLPGPEGVSTDWIATGSARAESYEGVLVATDAVTVTNTFSYGEWGLTDRSGTEARADDMASYSAPAVGDAFHSVWGVLWYSYGDYKLEPRSDSDLVILDSVPPAVDAVEPADGATDANPYLPVKAAFSERLKPSTVAEDALTLQAATGAVSGTVYYDSGRMSVVFDPDDPLDADTTYTATVKAGVEDQAGNPMASDYAWTFTTAAVSMEAYHGSIHNHTSYSDGTADPDTAFTRGRERGLDFMAVTDHSHSIDDSEWEDTLAQAISHTVDGTYVAIRGAEYSHGTSGHTNVFNTVRHPVREVHSGDFDYADEAATLDDFYQWMAEHPEAVGQFNHPGWMNFKDWEYHAEAERGMQLLEVGNGAYSYYVWTEREYRKALDYGWYVAPTNNGDTHTAEWAIDNPGRTGIWATELTEDGVIEALNAMRVFATEDGDFEVSLKADGAWMGETIPNDGQIDFEIYVNDPGAENLVSLELYTDQGQVITSTVPGASPYTWRFSLDVTTGIHYFFVRAEQEDGDRTVSAPIWTEGDVDVSPTKLQIAPAKLTTKAQANLDARVTNRGSADAVDVNVEFTVADTVVGSEVITVPAGSDAFATVNWTPDVTGPVTIAAQISNVPAGDNLEDNVISVERDIVDFQVPLVVIDNGHQNNVFASGDGNEFAEQLVTYGYNWIKDTDGITTTDLESAVLLIISDPGEQGDDLYTAAEEQAIADYVNEGGSLLVAGDSDYHDHGNVDEVNGILDQIDGSGIRLNSDGTYDDTDNGGIGPWHVLWHNFPATDTTGIGINVNTLVGFSGCSIYGVDGEGSPVPLTTGGGVTVTVEGDADTYQYDGDGKGDHFEYPDGARIPMAAVQELPGGGRIAVWGDSNESFSDAFTYVSGDGYQNEIYNIESIYWLTRRPLQRWDVARAREDAELDDTPDHLDELVWIEGTVTAEYGRFFDVMYVQDDTGGLTVYAPVSGETVPTGGNFFVGDRVRVIGRIEQYQGDTELQIDWDLEQIQVIGESPVPEPMELTSGEAAMEANEGWLVRTGGPMVRKVNDYNLILDDGSGPVRAFIDGYNGSFSEIPAGSWVTVVGLVSEDGEGPRVRVRDSADVVFNPPILLPIVMRNP